MTQFHRPRLRKESPNPITMKKAIARDVLMRLEEGTIVAKSIYLGSTYSYRKAKDAADVRSMFIDNQNCEVCAIGAVFTSGIRLYNKVEPHEIINVSKGPRSVIAQRWFTHDELSILEMYYENNPSWIDSAGVMIRSVHSQWTWAEVVLRQKMRGMDPVRRMKAIFETVAKTGTVDETAIIKAFKHL